MHTLPISLVINACASQLSIFSVLFIMPPKFDAHDRAEALHLFSEGLLNPAVMDTMNLGRVKYVCIFCAVFSHIVPIGLVDHLLTCCGYKD